MLNYKTVTLINGFWSTYFPLQGIKSSPSSLLIMISVLGCHLFLLPSPDLGFSQECQLLRQIVIKKYIVRFSFMPCVNILSVPDMVFITVIILPMLSVMLLAVQCYFIKISFVIL